MPTATFATRPILAFDGQPLTTAIENALLRLVVQSDVHAPDSCVMVFADPDRDLAKRSSIEFSQRVTVKAGRIGEDSPDVVFEGKVYSIGFDYDDAGATTMLVAYDNSYALFNGLHTATYRQVTDSDLAAKLAREAQLEPGDIESTSLVHEHLTQANETHWDLLARRAREIGFEVRVVGTKLHFRSPVDAKTGPDKGEYDENDRMQLTPGARLHLFSASMTAAQQVAEVEVRGWDVQNKRALVSVDPAATRSVKVHDSAADVAEKNAGARHVTVDLPLGSKAECDTAAAAAAERLASAYVYAEGSTAGDPQIVAGAAIGVGKTGGRLDGQYTITRASHVFDGEGYETHFIASGAHDRSLHGLLDTEREASRLSGAVVALVTSSSDPEKAGRVKLKFPWLADDYESDWARVAFAGAGAVRGLQLIPEVNDEVLVVFEHGDIRRPYVLGGLYNGVDNPPSPDAVDSSGGKVVRRALTSRVGHQLLLDDTDGSEKIEIRTGDGKLVVTLDQANGAVSITADKDVVVKAGGNVSVKADKDVSIEAAGSATFKGSRSVSIEASGELTLKGSTIKLN